MEAEAKDLAWWERDVADDGSGEERLMSRHREVHAAAKSLFTAQYEQRRARAESALFLYYGSGRLTLGGRTSLFDDIAPEEPPHQNVIQAATDAKTAQIFRNQVRPFFVTERGSSELQEKAEGMQKAVEAGFRDIGLWGLLGFLCCQDGQLFEAGGCMIVADFANSRIIGSRVRSWECFVPEREARMGDPRQMFIRQLVDRALLRQMFSDDEAAAKIIDEAQAVSSSWDDDAPSDDGSISDLLEVWTAFHLPSGRVDLRKKSAWGLVEASNDNDSDDEDKAAHGFEFDPLLEPDHDGRYCIILENGTIWDRPWPYDYFPIAWYKPSPNPVGYWSRSIPETLMGEQLELMKIGRRVHGIMHWHSIARLIAWRNARLNTSHLSNDYATILESSVPPSQAIHTLSPNAVPAELFQREGMIIAWAEKKVGLNEMSIAGTKPPGVDHAPGMEHLSDEQAVRHTVAFRAWEDFHLQAAKIIIDCYRQLYEYDPNFEVIFGEDKELVRLPWGEIDMERDRYRLKCWPTNLFAQTPSMKIKQINTAVQGGWLPAELALQSFSGNPDIDALIGDVNSARRNVEKKLADVQKNGLTDENMPHPHMNLPLCKSMASERINKLEANGERPETIDNVINFWEAAHKLELKLMQERAAAMAPPGAAPPGPPPGPPAGPPGAPPGPPPGAPPPANDSGAPPIASGAN